MTGPASERSSPLNSILSSTRREPLAASARMARPSAMLSRWIDTPSGAKPIEGTGQADAAGAVEPDREFRSFEPRVGDAPLAAHQGAERELDVQGARAHLAAVARAAELDALAA